MTTRKQLIKEEDKDLDILFWKVICSIIWIFGLCLVAIGSQNLSIMFLHFLGVLMITFGAWFNGLYTR